MTRINASMRDSIIRNGCDMAVAEEQQAADELEKKYDNLRGIAEKKTWALVPKKYRSILDAAPDGWFTKKAYIRIKVEDGRSTQLTLDYARAVPDSWRWSDSKMVEEIGDIPADNPAILAWDKANAAAKVWTEAKDAISVKRRDVRQKIAGIVNSKSTVAALLKEWPEASELMPSECTALATSVTELNNALGLPSA